MYCVYSCLIVKWDLAKSTTWHADVAMDTPWELHLPRRGFQGRRPIVLIGHLYTCEWINVNVSSNHLLPAQGLRYRS